MQRVPTTNAERHAMRSLRNRGHVAGEHAHMGEIWRLHDPVWVGSDEERALLAKSEGGNVRNSF